MTAEQRMAWALRFIGGVMMLAFGAVLMPFGWMDAIHRLLGLADLPAAPIVKYLTRSASALYTGFGLLYIYLATDVRRYQPVIRFQGRVMMFFGVVLLAVDAAAGLPWYWAAMEGPVVIVLGLILSILARRVPATQGT